MPSGGSDCRNSGCRWEMPRSLTHEACQHCPGWPLSWVFPEMHFIVKARTAEAGWVYAPVLIPFAYFASPLRLWLNVGSSKAVKIRGRSLWGTWLSLLQAGSQGSAGLRDVLTSSALHPVGSQSLMIVRAHRRDGTSILAFPFTSPCLSVLVWQHLLYGRL